MTSNPVVVNSPCRAIEVNVRAGKPVRVGLDHGFNHPALKGPRRLSPFRLSSQASSLGVVGASLANEPASFAQSPCPNFCLERVSQTIGLKDTRAGAGSPRLDERQGDLPKGLT